VQVNLAKGLDRSYEDKSLAEILAAPPSALAGLTSEHAVLKESPASTRWPSSGPPSTSRSPACSWPWRTSKADQRILHDSREGRSRRERPSGVLAYAKCQAA
jgi:hypothetical protein